MPHPHPSVKALLAADGGDDPVVAIRRRARSLVAEALAMGWEGPPFDMSELASLRGLKVAPSGDLTEDQDACVTPGLVLVNARKHRVRQRYSIAHEVAHTLFPDYEEELRRAGRLWRRHGDDSELERLCQAAAAEFLMPLEIFRIKAAARGRHLAGVLLLAVDFEASVEAAARRAVETAEEPLAAVFLRPKDPETGEWLRVERADGHHPYAPLGVSLVCVSDSCRGLALNKGVGPPLHGAAERAWKRASLARGSITIHHCSQESWEHAGVHGRWASEAMTLPRRARVPHEVLCLLRRLPT